MSAEFEEDIHRRDFDHINGGAVLSAGLFSQPQLKGPLSKQGEKGMGNKPWSRRTFVLIDPFLCYFEKDERMSKCKGVLYLRKCVVQELDQDVGDHKNCFSLTPLISSRSQSATEKATFLLSADDNDTMRHWLKALNRSVTKPSQEVLQEEIKEEEEARLKREKEAAEQEKKDPTEAEKLEQDAKAAENKVGGGRLFRCYISLFLYFFIF